MEILQTYTCQSLLNGESIYEISKLLTNAKSNMPLELFQSLGHNKHFELWSDTNVKQNMILKIAIRFC